MAAENINNNDGGVWANVFKLWPIVMAIIAGVIFSIRQEGRINVQQTQINNQATIIDHLTRAGEHLKNSGQETREDVREIKTMVLEINKKLDNEYRK